MFSYRFGRWLLQLLHAFKVKVFILGPWPWQWEY